jgi:hypothetical protein
MTDLVIVKSRRAQMAEINDVVEQVSESVANYEVGYRRPPKNSQFKPGQSGNPQGRRKVSGNIWNEARTAFSRTIRVKEGNTTKEVTAAEAFVRLQVDRAIRGNWRAFRWILKLADKINGLMPLTEAQEQSGVLRMPFDHFSKSPAEKAAEIKKEAARRNDLLARGLPYV